MHPGEAGLWGLIFDLAAATVPFDTQPYEVALSRLKIGGKVARSSWNGKGMWVALRVPDAHSKMGLPYIYMRTAGGPLVPWVASQTDMLANDWHSVPNEAP